MYPYGFRFLLLGWRESKKRLCSVFLFSVTLVSVPRFPGGFIPSVSALLDLALLPCPGKLCFEYAEVLNLSINSSQYAFSVVATSLFGDLFPSRRLLPSSSRGLFEFSSCSWVPHIISIFSLPFSCGCSVVHPQLSSLPDSTAAVFQSVCSMVPTWGQLGPTFSPV